MTLESRLTEALRQADGFEPSPDLFARMQRSITEDLAHRRRRAKIIAGIVTTLTAIASLVWFSAEPGTNGPLVDVWKLTVIELGIMGGLLIVLGPHIRRFARSYVDDVFHLNPETGGRFLRVLDVAYYLFFVGLMLVDADSRDLKATIGLGEGLDEMMARLGFFLGVMGALHALNVVALPVIGLVFNSTARLALRGEAGTEAPGESLNARRADRNARVIVIAVLVLVAAIAAALALQAVIGSFDL
jgi:hypothetical protein